ncbi:hypothetical protein MtrunA17_Chr8g0334351 [Medicago truncatula]|uniref:Transmembrane protein n=1 Tax=Medicago truncatula TaxID=3880 RepID=A0A396GCG2_MEDTR|nr:hypothetical protein MtrunA17_Chr8g0334351 [Medicago truncatula]
MWRSHVFCCSFICVLALANSHENKQQPMNAQDISYKRTKLCEGLFVCGCRCMLCCAVWFVHVIFFSVLLLQFQFCLWCFCLAVYDRLCLFNFTICLIVVACLNP